MSLVEIGWWQEDSASDKLSKAVRSCLSWVQYNVHCARICVGEYILCIYLVSIYVDAREVYAVSFASRNKGLRMRMVPRIGL